MHRRIFCFVFLLIAFFLKSDSLIIDGDESTIRSHLESTLKHDNSTIPSLLLLSMPMQFHYSASILHLRYRLDAMLLLAIRFDKNTILLLEYSLLYHMLNKVIITNTRYLWIIIWILGV